jgi:hypothetical protein
MIVTHELKKQHTIILSIFMDSITTKETNINIFTPSEPQISYTVICPHTSADRKRLPDGAGVYRK